MEKIYELEEVRTGLYDIYRAYLLKNINSENAIKELINISESSEDMHTKHLNSLLVQLTVKLILKINPCHKLFYKFLESNIVDNTTTNQTRYYLFNLVEQHFSNKLENLQDFILRYLPSYFGDNIELDGVEIIKAGLTQFLFLTHKTLSSYFPRHLFKWNHNFNGFSNGNFLILKKENNHYSEEDYPVQYFYDNNNERIIIDGIKLLQLGFILQIFKLIEKNFDTTGLFFSFSSDPEIIPTKASYGGSDILIYFFKYPIIIPTPQPKVVRKRKRPIDLDRKSLYFDNKHC